MRPSGQGHLGHHGGQGLPLGHADDGRLRVHLLLFDNLVQKLSSQLSLLWDDERDLPTTYVAQRC